MDTKKLAQEARAMVTNGEAKNITEAIAAVVTRELTALAGTYTNQALSNWIKDVTRVEQSTRYFYAIVYAYGRNVVNNGQRADHIHRFDSVAERTRFISEQEQDADEIKATHPLVKKALRYSEHLDWPQAV